MSRIAVYLAGGMRSEWRDRVRETCPGFQFLCPVGKEAERPMAVEEYGAWDLHHIRRSDIVFAYMGRENPSGIGLACEMGYAFGLGKTVLLVLEPGNNSHPDERLRFLTNVASVQFTSLQEGIEYLSSFVE